MARPKLAIKKAPLIGKPVYYRPEIYEWLASCARADGLPLGTYVRRAAAKYSIENHRELPPPAM